MVAGLRRRATGVEDPERHVRSAERYAELLGRSKGALMKTGQALSFVSMGPAVSPELQAAYRTALGRLRADAPPMAPELARETLEAELGRPVDEAFAEFEPEPLAAASIGQVHAARTHDGREVAVKVQYPGVAQAIAADLRNTELLATFLGLLMGMSARRVRLNVRDMARETGEQVQAELDYRREAANQAEFAALWRGHPFIRVPAVIGELSTGRVLTQELVLGRRWEQALDAPQELRDRWAETIHRFAYGSANHFRLFNADPHPGNYLFHDDGLVTFLDFGSVARSRTELWELTNELMRAVLREDVEGVCAVAVRAGVWRPTDPVAPQEAFEYWRGARALWFVEQPFTVTPEYMAAHVERQLSPTGPSGNAMRHVTSPRDWAILNRMDLGVLSLTAELRATADWRAIAEEWFEGRPPAGELGRLHAAWLAEHPTAIRHASLGRLAVPGRRPVPGLPRGPGGGGRPAARRPRRGARALPRAGRGGAPRPRRLELRPPLEPGDARRPRRRGPGGRGARPLAAAERPPGAHAPAPGHQPLLHPARDAGDRRPRRGDRGRRARAAGRRRAGRADVRGRLSDPARGHRRALRRGGRGRAAAARRDAGARADPRARRVARRARGGRRCRDDRHALPHAADRRAPPRPGRRPAQRAHPRARRRGAGGRRGAVDVPAAARRRARDDREPRRQRDARPARSPRPARLAARGPGARRRRGRGAVALREPGAGGHARGAP